MTKEIDIKLPSSFRIPGVPLEINWYKKEGDHIAPGDKIAVLSSSKYDTTFEIEGEGIVLSTNLGEMRTYFDIKVSSTMTAGTIVKLYDGDPEEGEVKPGDVLCKIQPDDDTPKIKKKRKRN